MVTPLDKYVKSLSGSSGYSGDLIWPLADSRNPFRDLLDRGTGVVTVRILSVSKVYRHNVYVYVVYNARINHVIIEPHNTVELPSKGTCIKDPNICELAKRQYEAVSNLKSLIKENNTIKLAVPAFIARDSSDKSNLTIEDVATPFPLLEPGYSYLVFLDLTPNGIRVHYDYVWGPWAYLVLERKVYSLNYVKPPSNVSLDPSKPFDSPSIHWQPYPYSQLRKIAIQKLSVKGERLNVFISRITG
jgi:hypothetical protein